MGLMESPAILTYPLENDGRFFGTMEYRLGTYDLSISACTSTGRSNADSPQKPNEDTLSVSIINDNLVAAIFDGCTSLKPITSLKDRTGARFASHFLKSALEN